MIHRYDLLLFWMTLISISYTDLVGDHRIKAFCARPLTDAAKYQEREKRQRALASSSVSL